ncbi:unnamed protein product, partial [Timema podura]|nr:unnamed protein product [Timema podura]
MEVNGARKQLFTQTSRVVVPNVGYVSGRLGDDSPASYYAVFDGHAGTYAAVYSVCHLHQFLAESPFYPTDPVQAFKEAFLKTNFHFLEKSNIE